MKNVLKIVVDASLKAGACILGYYKSEYEIKEKGYHNPVTTADHAANDKLKKILLREFPDYGWFSEETLDSPERTPGCTERQRSRYFGNKEFSPN